MRLLLDILLYFIQLFSLWLGLLVVLDNFWCNLILYLLKVQIGYILFLNKLGVRACWVFSLLFRLCIFLLLWGLNIWNSLSFAVDVHLYRGAAEILRFCRSTTRLINSLVARNAPVLTSVSCLSVLWLFSNVHVSNRSLFQESKIVNLIEIQMIILL